MNDCDQNQRNAKTLFEERGLDMFKSIMTNELKNEMEQLLVEQKNYQREIAQLKKERNFLFKLLKKQQKKIQDLKNHEIQDFKQQKIQNLKNHEIEKKNKLSFCNQEQISISPSTDVKLNEQKEKSTNIFNYDISKNNKRYFFSKDFFLGEIQKYTDIEFFERAYEKLELSKNGDSMISFFVNSVGNAFISFNEEIQKLQNIIELSKIDSQQQEISLFTKMSQFCDENKKFDNETPFDELKTDEKYIDFNLEELNNILNTDSDILNNENDFSYDGEVNFFDFNFV